MAATVHPFAPTATVVQDGTEISLTELMRRAESLSGDLRGIGRLAVATTRVDTLMCALLAARDRALELVLLRQSGWDPERLRQVGAHGLLGDDLRISPTGVAPSTIYGNAILLATSGTTGAPKLARHSLDRLLGRIRPPRPGRDPGTWLLTYHPASFAGIQVLLSSAVGGGRLISCAQPSVPHLAETALAQQPSHISGTPTFWRALMLALGERARELKLQKITLGGETVDQGILDRLHCDYPDAGITHIYASTEAGALFAVHDRRAGFPRLWLEQPVDGVELRVRDDILQVRSPRTMLGYDSRHTQAPYTDDGWLVTNDLIRLHEDRALFLGRIDATINVGGAKVSPDEVEGVLLQVPGVTEARVYAVPSSITGALVAADLCLAPGRKEAVVKAAVADHARSVLDAYKVPRVIKFVSSLAISETGKKSRG